MYFVPGGYSIPAYAYVPCKSFEIVSGVLMSSET